MTVRKIRTSGDEVLRKKSLPVEKVDKKIQQILNDMAETMYAAPNGGGLAACQIGILKRLVVADMGQGLLKLVNPQIIKSEGKQIDIEGCLSIPNTWGKVKRPSRVQVQAWDENGDEIIVTATGPMAKCLCHEIDHLEGILFTDKVIEYVEIE